MYTYMRYLLARSIWGILRQIDQTEAPIIIFFPFKYIINDHKKLATQIFHFFFKIWQ